MSAVVGKNILDNLTTGMYTDSKVIYREYIQNACDQIDIAIEKNILDKEEALIEIFLDYNKRHIIIEDNATGVKSENFINELGDIANSNKKIGENKGFRGIGRLCGLAYCKTLKFITSYKGEDKKSEMICDAEKMRKMLFDNKKHTLDEVWDSIITFRTEDYEKERHFFRVEMIDINEENKELLSESSVSSYLSFIAPVAYRNKFIFRDKIYRHARELNYKIDEYCIKLNGKDIFKEYGTYLKDKNDKKYDDIYDISFKDFYDDNRNLIAWMWIGLSNFKTQIPSTNKMRGIRLRSSNIQLGDSDTLEFLFKEPRGNYYFIGEVFSVDKNLIPNSQRNYFNENKSRALFENSLNKYFVEELHKLYYIANKIKNAYKHEKDLEDKKREFENKTEKGFINDEEKKKLEIEIEKLNETTNKDKRYLDRLKNDNSDSLDIKVGKDIIKRTEKETREREKNILKEKKKKKSLSKNKYITDSMSKLNKRERNLVLKILSIISDTAPKELAEEIIGKIQNEMK